MVKKFRLGGLYWHIRVGYVECTRKAYDIAELTSLKDGSKSLAYDGDQDYEEARKGLLDVHVLTVQGRVEGLRQDLDQEEKYLAKLTEVWPNVDGRTQIPSIDIAVSNENFEKLDLSACKGKTIFNQDTGVIVVISDYGNVKSKYLLPDRDLKWAVLHNTGTISAEQIAGEATAHTMWKTLGEQKPGEEME